MLSNPASPKKSGISQDHSGSFRIFREIPENPQNIPQEPPPPPPQKIHPGHEFLKLNLKHPENPGRIPRIPRRKGGGRRWCHLTRRFGDSGDDLLFVKRSIQVRLPLGALILLRRRRRRLLPQRHPFHGVQRHHRRRCGSLRFRGRRVESRRRPFPSCAPKNSNCNRLTVKSSCSMRMPFQIPADSSGVADMLAAARRRAARFVLTCNSISNPDFNNITNNYIDIVNSLVDTS